MKKLLNIVLCLTIFSSCHLNGNSDKYTIEGTVKNHSAKSIYLEKLGMKEVVLVDSAKLDDKGFFKMEGVSEEGFYRVKLDEQVFWLFLLQPSPYKLTIDMKAKEPFIITGPPDNDEFQTALKTLNDNKQELENAKYMYTLFQQMGVSPDSIMLAANVYNSVSAAYVKAMKDGISKSKNALVAFFYATNLPLDQFAADNLTVLQRLEKEKPTSSYAKEFRAVYNQYEQQAKAAEIQKEAANLVAIGKPAPEIDLKNPEGQVMKLSSLKGKVVLIDFWASWCGPCRVEMPNVVAAYNKYKAKGFTVYSVSLDKDMNAWKNSIKALNMPWENHVSDLKWWQCEAAVKYGVNGIPATFLLDKNGVIVASNLRGAELDKKLAELLQ